MRMGKVKFNVLLEYVVDMDNPSMVDKARTWLEQDMFNLVEDGDIYSMIIVEPAPELPSDTIIHSGLLKE